jgi:hypothetical protein
MKYYQTEYIEIEYVDELNIIKTTWLRNTLHEEYRDVFEKTLELASQKKCYAWLFDQTDKSGISLNEDLDWLNKTFIPNAMEAMGGSGVRIATILSKSIFAQLSAKRIAQDNAEQIKQHVFDLQYFEQQASALAYLNAVRR